MTNKNEFDWTVVGAGPAGIAAVGKLLDHQVDPKRIAWIDPLFQVGDFGTKWHSVPSNTKVDLFCKFLYAVNSFEYEKFEKNFSLCTLDRNQTCELSHMVFPLEKVTDVLKEKVFAFQKTVQKLNLEKNNWQVSLDDGSSVLSKNVILTIGSDPKSLIYPNLKSIPLDIALNKQKLAQACTSEDTVAVFGSSHSAVLALRNLLEVASPKRILNFYKSPLCYAVHMEKTILFNDTGLKGSTADWARANLHGNLPDRLERVYSSKENLAHFLPQCSSAVYAIGFQKRHLVIEDFPEIFYNNKNGIIAPGLFGFGIAFPEAKIDPFGILEHRVGLWKFMEYLTSVLPIWLEYPL